MELHVARYRLLFHHPFGTAHGVRDGTDAVFVRLRRGAQVGHGEATLPPYLRSNVHSVIRALSTVRTQRLEAECQAAWAGHGEAEWAGEPASRAALMSAYFDLISKEKDTSIGTLLEVPAARALAMVTLGHGAPEAIPEKLAQLPQSRILKVKLGSGSDAATLAQVTALDDRRLFLDANQGWTDVQQALDAIAMAGADRVVGVEQPFAADRWMMHRELRKATNVPVYADESVQGPADLERAAGSFDGINIKLMKCGGPDVAAAMARRARELGLRVMLGSMSESSLGSAVMAQIAGLADLADLDGPWLVHNDPFHGIGIADGRMVVNGVVGAGVEIKPALLHWTPIGA